MQQRVGGLSNNSRLSFLVFGVFYVDCADITRSEPKFLSESTLPVSHSVGDLTKMLGNTFAIPIQLVIQADLWPWCHRRVATCFFGLVPGALAGWPRVHKTGVVRVVTFINLLSDSSKFPSLLLLFVYSISTIMTPFNCVCMNYDYSLIACHKNYFPVP